MSIAIQTQIGVLPQLPDEGDSFYKKAGQWAFSSPFPAARQEIEEILGRFAIAPVDAVAMRFLEDHVAPLNCLPVGHLYDHALTQLATQLKDTPIGPILQDDVALRDYVIARKMEQILS